MNRRRRKAAGDEPRGRPSGLAHRLDEILEIAQAGMRGVDEHGHVSGAVLVLPHFHVGVGDLAPREHLAHAGIDAAIEHEPVGGARLFQMGEMRALRDIGSPPLVSPGTAPWI